MVGTRKQASLKNRPERRRRAATDTGSRDDLLDAALEQYPNVLTAYRTFEDKKPIILFDIQEQRLYVYPYKEFRDELSERSQRNLKDQYERAQIEDKIVVFVRDNVRRKLVSYSLDQQ